MKNLSKMFARYRKIRDFQSARLMIANHRFDHARRLLQAIIDKNPDSVAARVLWADSYLFEGNLDQAMVEYRCAADLIQSIQGIDDRDRAFLSAYVNFRKLAIGKKRGVLEFSDWRSVAMQINEMPAHRVLKRNFALPYT